LTLLGITYLIYIDYSNNTGMGSKIVFVDQFPRIQSLFVKIRQLKSLVHLKSQASKKLRPPHLLKMSLGIKNHGKDSA
jgi:hypothetical protein